MSRIAVFGMLALAGCATMAADRSLVGTWGGQHVGLTLGATGGRVDYDCAAGTIDGLVIPRGDGNFEALGTHIPGHGGPDRVGEIRPAYQTRYSGIVRGDRMTLQARVETGVLLGPFTLTRGAEPMLMRCL